MNRREVLTGVGRVAAAGAGAGWAACVAPASPSHSTMATPPSGHLFTADGAILQVARVPPDRLYVAVRGDDGRTRVHAVGVDGTEHWASAGDYLVPLVATPRTVFVPQDTDRGIVTGARSVEALEPTDGDRRWREPVPEHAVRALCAGEGTLVGGSYDDALGAGEHLFAMRAADGDVAWRVPTSDVTDGWRVGETVLVETSDGVAAHDIRTGKRRWSMTLGGRDRLAAGSGVLAVARSGLRLDGLEGLLGVDLTTGETRWRLTERGSPVQPTALAPALDDRVRSTSRDTVYAGDERGRVRALDVRSGRPRWALDLQSSAVDDIALHETAGGSRRLVALADGAVYGLGPGAASPDWTQPLPAEPRSAVRVVGDVVYVALSHEMPMEEDRLRAYGADEGTLRWDRSVGRGGGARFVPVGDALLVVLGDTVYAVTGDAPPPRPG
ncbi:MAG: PQQ-binding-like beta-propeller repeat protein [Halobacteriaceae archaeon]